MNEKRLLASVAVIAIILLAISGTVSAIDFTKTVNDVANDVTNPDVDITKVSSRKSGDEIVFTIDVSGEIKDHDEYNEYGYWIYITEMKSENQNVWIAYSDGEANWVDYSGQATNAGISEFSISGGTLDMSIPDSVFSNMDDFYFWAYCVHSDLQSGGGSVDYLYSWTETSSGSSGGSGTGSGSGSDVSDEAIFQSIWAGSMILLALAIIVPIVIIVIIVVVLLKVLKSEEESEGRHQQQQQYRPPPKEQQPLSAEEEQGLKNPDEE